MSKYLPILHENGGNVGYKYKLLHPENDAFIIQYLSTHRY